MGYIGKRLEWLITQEEHTRKIMPTVWVPPSTEDYSSPFAEAWEWNRVIQNNPCKGDTLILFHNGGTQTVEDFKKEHCCSGDKDTVTDVTDDEEPTPPLKRKNKNPRKKQQSFKSRLGVGPRTYKKLLQSKNTQKTRRKSNRQCKPSVRLNGFEWSKRTTAQDPPLAPPKLQLRQAAGEWRDCDDVPDQTLSGFIKACRAGVDSYEFELHGVRRSTNFYVMRLLGKPESYILRNVHQPGDKLLARLSGA